MLTVKFTPKQIIVLKKLLPTVKLNAYDIQIYQEIQQALENAFDDNKKKPINKKKYDNTNTKSQFINVMKGNSKKPVQEEINSQPKHNTDTIQENIKVEESESFEDIEDDIEEIEDDNNNEESESIFTVIDRRKGGGV